MVLSNILHIVGGPLVAASSLEGLTYLIAVTRILGILGWGLLLTAAILNLNEN